MWSSSGSRTESHDTHTMAEIIRGRLLTAVLLLFSPFIVAGADEIPTVSSVSRTTIIVSDIDRSLELFQNTLGLLVRVDLVLDSDAVNKVMGTHDKRVRIVILQSGESVIGNVALLTYLGEVRATTPSHDETLDVGEVVLVMETTAIDAIHAAVRSAGYAIVTPPIVLFPMPDMIEQRREMMFIGPDGIAINLIQPGIAKDEFRD